ncbi:MAG: hypothetical protein M1819_001138 [Sarea resinae]|nr:MAG: hypothetical protein M1819_001138 [Sarea resinae]
MVETQPAPAGLFALPPPSFLAQPYPRNPRLPPPPQLPPLSIPPPPSRPEFQNFPPQRPDFPQPQSTLTQPAASHPSLERWPSSTLEPSIPPNPYTSPRSDPMQSPRHGAAVSPRSDFRSRLPPRRLSERSLYEDHRSGIPAPPPFESMETMSRQHGGLLPSPAYTAHRGSEGSFRGSASSSTGYASSARADAAIVSHEIPPSSNSNRYQIIVRQQPLAARACGFGERDRRVIDPPPIVELKLKDEPSTAATTSSPSASSSSELRYPFNVVHCTLWNANGTSDETALAQPDRRTTRRLMGTLVASPFVGLDESDHEGCFFCFPDLSCRTHGQYRLRFVLMRLEPMDLQPGGFTPIITHIMSDVFTVFTAKDFPGMRASTPLTVALKRQGCAISVKKGNEKTSGHEKGQGRAGGEEPPASSSGGGGAGGKEGAESSQKGAGRGKRRRKE